MSQLEEFEDAQRRVRQLPRTPSNTQLLKLYALFKQATLGDVTGKRPGLLDPRGRAKFDAWSEQRGKTQDSARQQYIDLVAELESSQ